MSWVLLAGVLALVFAAVILAAELVLRRWTSAASPGRERATSHTHGDHGVSAHKMPADRIAARDADFSAAHWDELQRYLTSTKHAEGWSVPGQPQKLNRLSASDFDGREFSVRSRERTTTDQPSVSEGEVLCLGGSTTFCFEVGDRLTWASVLQRRLNVGGGRPLRVRNLGIGGTPGLERIRTYRLTAQPESGDVAVFLFGDNDSGWKCYGSRKGRAHANLPLLVRLLLRGSRASELFAWIYGEMAPRYLRRLATEMAETTIAEAEEAAAWARARGARVLFVLQPHIFTLAHPDAWDRRIISNTARDLPIMLSAAYGRYRRWIEACDIGVSATHIFDREPGPIYLDWGHVNTRGNELIADFVFSELVTRGMLGSVSTQAAGLYE